MTGRQKMWNKTHSRRHIKQFTNRNHLCNKKQARSMSAEGTEFIWHEKKSCANGNYTKK